MSLKSNVQRVVVTTASLFFIACSSASLSHAAASDLDDCILDITFQCVDDADFWGCYNVGVELCKNQTSASISIPRGTIATIETKAKKRAQQVLLKRTASR
ncbi:MAG: hypothetical protein KDJ90_17005 [Nitratireductor sp.]|nr:hypothetical protein [Nitratireductor sp.]